MIHKLVAELVTSAPLIMSGDEPLERGDPLRGSAVKGALRFWWRALQWPVLRSEHGSNNAALKALHNAEGTLFGAAAGDNGKQAKFLLRIGAEQRLDNECFAKGKVLNSYPGAVYLLGQGQHQRGSGAKGAGLVASGPLTLHLSWRKDNLSETEQHSLIQAVMALGLLGSVGARARKGFGSLSLQSLTLDDNPLPIPTNLDELSKWFATLPRGNSQELPPFTAFGSESRCWKLDLKPAQEDLALINEYGLQMMAYRLSDKSEFAGGQKGLGLFKADSRAVAGVIEGKKPEIAPRRAVFGLPNNVFFVDSRTTVSVEPEKHERRASPLFAHLHRFPSGERIMLATLLPAQFLPDREKIEISSKGKARHYLAYEPDWSVLHGFIKHCGAKELTL